MSYRLESGRKSNHTASPEGRAKGSKESAKKRNPDELREAGKKGGHRSHGEKSPGNKNEQQEA